MCDCKCVWAGMKSGWKVQALPCRLLLYSCLFYSFGNVKKGQFEEAYLINIIYICCLKLKNVKAHTSILLHNSQAFLCLTAFFCYLRTMWARRPSTRLLVRAVWSVSTLSWFREQKLSKSCDQSCALISFPLFYPISQIHLCKGSPPNSNQSSDEINTQDVFIISMKMQKNAANIHQWNKQM